MLKVFLTEDESVIREGLRDSIPWELYGFTFAGEATDGEMALPMVRKIKPDVLITDIKMPFMDGLSFSRLVRKELPNTKIIILSGYDDFEYARKAIELQVDQYLLKPVTKSDMIKALEAVSHRIEEERKQKDFLSRFTQESREYERFSRREFFEKLMEGSLSVSEIYEQAEKLGIELDAPGYNIVLFTIQPQVSAPAYSETTAMLEDELIQYFLRYPAFLLFRCNLLTYAILIKGDPSMLDAQTARCVETIERRCSVAKTPVDWYVAIGEPTTRLSGLSKSFAEANRVLSYRHLLPSKHILTSALTKQTETRYSTVGVSDLEKIDPLTIRSFVQTGLEEEIDSFVKEYLGNLGQTLESVMFRHYLIISVRVNALAAVQASGGEAKELQTSLPDMSSDLSVEELQTYFSEVLHAAIEIRDKESQKKNSDLVDRALQYIDHNYTNDSISLNTVAESINISANYLSAIFSQKMGISFVEYLTQKRMARAKILLRQSSKRSGEIAYEVGYKDPHYFSFVFKKTQGCTPKAYRATKETS